MIASDARPDVARIRLDNALALFDEFVRATVKHADAATLRGLEGRFAERLQIQPSYWSQIKSRARQIGERLARQFEVLCHKPHGWMDEAHPRDTTSFATPPPLRSAGIVVRGSPRAGDSTARQAPVAVDAAQDAGLIGTLDDDERFIVGLVLTYYRRHPQRARTRLLELLGEVLAKPSTEPRAQESVARQPAMRAASAESQGATDERVLWERTRQGVAPLKRKR